MTLLGFLITFFVGIVFGFAVCAILVVGGRTDDKLGEYMEENL
jgi:hypothetical protein